MRIFFRILLSFILCLGLLTGGFFFWFYTGIGLPKFEVIKSLQRDQTSKIMAADGSVLTELHAEQNREDLDLAEMCQDLQDAVIAIEDERFWQHGGVDWYGIARAFWINVVKGEVRQGGSTITQQYVKNTLSVKERNYWDKLEEANLAFQLEKRYEKTEILEMYMNDVYFGQGCYGVKTAARTFFGKTAGELSLSESATLAGIIRSPNGYSPYFAPAKAKERRDVVLSKMAQLGYISTEEQDIARQEPLTVIPIPEVQPSPVAPYFVEYVTQYLKQQFGDELVFRGGLRVYTTLDLNIQTAAEEAVATILDRPGDPEAGVVVLDPKTGQIKAMVGGRDFTQAKFNLAAQGGRQPGSAFKVFVLAAALSMGISPNRTYDSSPGTIEFPDGTKWTVTNSDGSGHGLVTLWEGTVRSINCVYARLIKDVGAQRVVSIAKDMGITSPVDPNPAISIGGLTYGVNPLEMASAFGTLANGGVHCLPIGVLKVTDAKGNVLLENQVESTQAIREDVAAGCNEILGDAVSAGTGRSAQIGRPQAGKTGTTDDYTDAWFVGYTPDLSCAVWVGHPEGRVPMRSVHGMTVYGGTFPARIWKYVMERALEGVPPSDFTGTPNFAQEDSKQTVLICPDSGLLATQYCPNPQSTDMLGSQVPTENCDIHGPENSYVSVPSVVTMSLSNATRVLNASGFAVQEQHVASSSAPPGTVTAQSPGGGTRAPRGSTVIITVSDGPSQSSKVPNVVGMSESQAISKLYAEGFTAKSNYVPAPAADVGKVLYQSPSADSNAAPGSQVYITVGKAVS
ncbi:MAG: PBP1A family penicillin-binding protein [Candidatus Geothermincolia bacterium]